jgi:hypothetical protein
MQSEKAGNPRFLEMAARLGGGQIEKDTTPKREKLEMKFPLFPSYVFTLKNDEFGKELTAKLNERFKDTNAFINNMAFDTGKEYFGFNFVQRFGIITTLFEDANLRKFGYWPITPVQSEVLHLRRALPKNGNYPEALGLVYVPNLDNSSIPNGYDYNQREADALRMQLDRYKEELGISYGDLRKTLLVVNPGLEKDRNFKTGVRPIVLPGVTRVYDSEAINRPGGNYSFEYGLENGVPSLTSMGNGERILKVHNTQGLYSFYRCSDFSLRFDERELAHSLSDSRMTFAKQEAFV